MKETDLYPPIKAYLEGQGYSVKAEIGACDVMAMRGAEPPVIIELKRRMSLALILQATARQTLFDHVYIAVPEGKATRSRDIQRLCRRLGLGLLTLPVAADGALQKDGRVTAWLDPGPYTPRKRAARAGRLLREFERRVGDPNLGGSRGTRMTAYRQEALNCAAYLATHGPTSGQDVAAATGVPRATRMMYQDHYGWFERVATGIYALSPKGRCAVEDEATRPAAKAGRRGAAQDRDAAPERAASGAVAPRSLLSSPLP
ncbi:MAG: DUF2161 family putative PD-(D/E)XK-type phosphodiesterase [Pseudomonadota bacterium]